MSILSEIIPGLLLALVAAAIITGCVILLSNAHKDLTVEKLFSALVLNAWVYRDDANHYILILQHRAGPTVTLDVVYTESGT